MNTQDVHDYLVSARTDINVALGDLHMIAEGDNTGNVEAYAAMARAELARDKCSTAYFKIRRALMLQGENA